MGGRERDILRRSVAAELVFGPRVFRADIDQFEAGKVGADPKSDAKISAGIRRLARFRHSRRIDLHRPVAAHRSGDQDQLVDHVVTRGADHLEGAAAAVNSDFGRDVPTRPGFDRFCTRSSLGSRRVRQARRTAASHGKRKRDDDKVSGPGDRILPNKGSTRIGAVRVGARYPNGRGERPDRRERDEVTETSLGCSA